MKIKTNHTIGKIKPMHAVNNGPIQSTSTTKENFNTYKEAGIPYARNHDATYFHNYGSNHTVDINYIFTDFSRDVNDPTAYDFEITDDYIKTTNDAGTETFYRLGSSIEHWVKKYNTLPPADFKKWAQICEHIIMHYNEGWANGFYYNLKYWEIWNEPDLDGDNSLNKRTWGGTKLEFFDLYETTAKYLKVRFPHLNIGGPALAWDEEWADDFLAEMSRRQVPIDFFSWHQYLCNPSKMGEKALRIRKLLDKHGYSETESNLNEWNYIRNWDTMFVYSIEQRIGMKGAAFISACMAVGQNGSIDMMMYYDARPSAWNGLFDSLTLAPLKGYYAIKLFNELYKAGEQLECIVDEDDIYAVSAIDKDNKVKILLTYYTDDDSEERTKEFKLKLDGRVETVMRRFLVDKERNEDIGSMKLAQDESVIITMTPNSILLLTEE